MALTRQTDIVTAFDTAMNKIYPEPEPQTGSINVRKKPIVLDDDAKRSFLPNYSFLTEGLTAASGLDFQVSGQYEEDSVAQAINSASGVITT